MIKITPAIKAVKKIALGKVFSVSLVSSASELNESKPVNEKQSKVAPVINAPTLVYSFQNGSKLHNWYCALTNVPSAFTPPANRLYTIQVK